MILTLGVFPELNRNVIAEFRSWRAPALFDALFHFQREFLNEFWEIVNEILGFLKIQF